MERRTVRPFWSSVDHFASTAEIIKSPEPYSGRDYAKYYLVSYGGTYMAKGRCRFCVELRNCPVCGNSIETLNHVGVRGSSRGSSGIRHYAIPCMDRIDLSYGPLVQLTVGDLAAYNGGPLWKNGYKWYNVFWGSYWNGNSVVAKINNATGDIEGDLSYSGGLREYNVGVGVMAGHIVVAANPPATVAEGDIGTAILEWISSAQVPNLGTAGAYNIFLPPGVTALLGKDTSCSTFCDYHDSVNGSAGPFFTLEPYPCTSGCNQCTSNSFGTITQGLSEEMVELKTDMNPGTGWVIGNEEICDYCDQNFVCNQISSGEYVNAWYSNKRGKCWTPK